MQKIIGNYFLIVTILVCFALFAGCERKGALEKAGEKADKAVDKARDKVEDAGDSIEDATDEIR
jgi:predicted small lipoprotein YifL